MGRGKGKWRYIRGSGRNVMRRAELCGGRNSEIVEVLNRYGERARIADRSE
jgi:hypothetical protein